MNDKLEIPKPHFVLLLDSVMQAAACSSLLPGEEPPPDWIAPDPEACQHWLEMVAVVKAADAAIQRACTLQRVGDALGGGTSDSLRGSNRSDLMQFVDDFCGTPPKWPLPWPPPRARLNPDGLRPAVLLVAGGRFHAAADRVEDEALQAELLAAADRLFETGLSRLS